MTVPRVKLLEAAEDLARPFTPEALRWKFDRLIRDDGVIVAGEAVCYIDRGLVVGRLNHVVPHLWSNETTEFGPKHLQCRLTIDGVTRHDVGEGKNPKEQFSDALKRAAVLFGVGAYLMRVPKVTLTVTDGFVEVVGTGAVKSLALTEKGRDALRDRYRKWLDEHGVAVFGDPLPDGDAGDAQSEDDYQYNAEDGFSVAQLGLGLGRALIARELLESGRFNGRQIRGHLAAAGAAGLPVDVDREEAERALRNLEDVQLARLADLIGVTSE